MRRRHLRTFSVISVVIGVFSRLAAAQVRPAFAHFEPDTRVNFQKLQASSEAAIDWSVEGYSIRVDASAVLSDVDFEKLKEVSLDFNRWASLRMPGVREMRVLEEGTRDGKTIPTVVWLHQETLEVSSRHFMKVYVESDVPTDFGPSTGFGNTFELFHPQKKYSRSRNQRPLDDRPMFKRFVGSWYLEPIADNRVYARYVMMAEVDSVIPAFLVVPISRAQMVSGIKEMIRIFRKQAEGAGSKSEDTIKELDWAEGH